MYIPNVNRILFNIENYDNDEEVMFKDIAKILQILVKNNEICTFEYDDCGIYALQHNYSNRGFGDVYPYWLNPEEQEIIDNIRYGINVEDEDENNKE